MSQYSGLEDALSDDELSGPHSGPFAGAASSDMYRGLSSWLPNKTGMSALDPVSLLLQEGYKSFRPAAPKVRASLRTWDIFWKPLLMLYPLHL